MADEYSIAGVELTDDRYTVEQSLIRNKYKAMDAAGNVVLRGKQKMFKMKEEFPFVDAEGDEVFTVKAGGILDIAGDYSLTDATTDEPVVSLDNQWSWTIDHWIVRDPNDESVIAEIKSRSQLIEILRNLHTVFRLIPHKYDITDANGTVIGGIEGTFSLKDRYEVHVDSDADVPREAVIAAAMVIDAIEGN